MAGLNTVPLRPVGSAELLRPAIVAGAFTCRRFPVGAWLKAARWPRLLVLARPALARMSSTRMTSTCATPASMTVPRMAATLARTRVGSWSGATLMVAPLVMAAIAGSARGPAARSPVGAAVRWGARRAAGAIAVRRFHLRSL